MTSSVAVFQLPTNPAGDRLDATIPPPKQACPGSYIKGLFADPASNLPDITLCLLSGPFDLAPMPVGGYEPRWFMQDMHINPEEAVQLHNDIRSKYSVGIHWGAFPLTAEPIDQPPTRLRAAAKILTDSTFVIYPQGKTGQVPINSLNSNKGTE